MASSNFVGALQSGTFISLQKDGKMAGPNMQTLATPNYGIGYRGVAADDRNRKPYSKMMIN